MAAAIPRLQAVRLFGSHWAGTNRQGSDVDLAVTVSDEASEPGRYSYSDESDQWQDTLSDRPGLEVHLHIYEPGSDRVPLRASEAGRIPVWRR
ncbi:MAG: nucleotidyltransferase domain-containing protein [Methylobacterium sp.]|uniref:nucleotidyltransferase domain-containing protein n=1 Tax=Methylobacterium sp. TaxID=409 RepID=UPI0034521630|nr:nucleotidyltransferase domain-containing protein [Methylobacterium sp.]